MNESLGSSLDPINILLPEMTHPLLRFSLALKQSPNAARASLGHILIVPALNPNPMLTSITSTMPSGALRCMEVSC